VGRIVLVSGNGFPIVSGTIFPITKRMPLQANLRTTFSSMDRPDLLQRSMKNDWHDFAQEFDL
jgi:hypothetical protein